MPSVNAAHAWEAVLSRDRRGDGRFVYAVSSRECIAVPLALLAARLATT